jgi:hypothetical protein
VRGKDNVRFQQTLRKIWHWKKLQKDDEYIPKEKYRESDEGIKSRFVMRISLCDEGSSSNE